MQSLDKFGIPKYYLLTTTSKRPNIKKSKAIIRIHTCQKNHREKKNICRICFYCPLAFGLRYIFLQLHHQNALQVVCTKNWMVKCC